MPLGNVFCRREEILLPLILHSHHRVQTISDTCAPCPLIHFCQAPLGSLRDVPFMQKNKFNSCDACSWSYLLSTLVLLSSTSWQYNNSTKRWAISFSWLEHSLFFYLDFFCYLHLHICNACVFLYSWACVVFENGNISWQEPASNIDGKSERRWKENNTLIYLVILFANILVLQENHDVF